MNKVICGLHWAFMAGLFLVPALVLTVPSGIGYGAILMLLMALLMLSLGFKHPNKVQLSKDEWILIGILVAYPAVAALNMLFHGWDWAHFDNPSRFLLVLPMFFVLRRFGASEKILYWGIVVGAIGAGSFGYYQKWVLDLPVADGFTHKIPFGDISLMLGVFAITYLIPRQNEHASTWLKVAVVVALLFGLTGSFASGTRGGWIAIPFMSWLLLGALIANKKFRVYAFGGVILALVAVYFGNSLVKYKVDRAVTTTQEYFSEGKVRGSAGTRFEMWRGAVMMFQEEPLIGEGKDSYGPRLQELIAEGKIHKSAGYTHAHNDLLNLMAELGILGGLALIALYGGLMYFFYRAKSIDLRWAVAGLALVFGYIDFSMTQAMFEHNISTTFVAIFAVIFAGLLMHKRNQLAQAPPDDA